MSSAAARVGSPGHGRNASSPLTRAPGARRLSRTCCALSSRPRMRTARCAIVMLRIPSRTHSTRRPGEVEQRGGRRRRRAVAVLPLGADVVDVGRIRDRGEAAVRLHAHVVAPHVVLGKVGLHRQVDRDLERQLGHLALELADRLGDELAVQVEADGRDVARLLAAEQVARAADLEVAHRDLEARPEVGELADRPEPLVRLLGERVGPAGAAGTRTRAGPGGRRGRAAGTSARGRAGRRGRRRACSPSACRGRSRRSWCTRARRTRAPRRPAPRARAGSRPSARARSRCAPRARARARARRRTRCPARGCARRTPGPHAAARAGSPRRRRGRRTRRRR